MATLTAPPGLEPDAEVIEVPAGTAAGARRKLFDPHLEPEAIEDGLASGSLIRGTIRVSSSKVSMAFVRPDGAKSQDREWVVRGTKYRNRAVHGDTVIIQPILYGRSEDSSSEDEPVMATAVASDSDEEVVFTKPNVAGSAAIQRDEEEVKMAKVVAIAEKKGSGRVLVCTLHPDRQKKGDGQVHAEDSFVKAIPTDKRLPTMLLQINHVTKKVLKLPGKLDPFILWPMQIITWNEFSKQPLAKLQGQCLGRAGSLEAEEKHALIANELDDHDVDFPDDELDEVDGIVREAKENFLSEVAKRKDLRSLRIFTIDPATAKDLDDAIHVVDLPNKNQIEVGVHIADVAHFLKLGTVTDKEAQRRSTSVYLIGRVLPMLPHGLCNHLCSLNPNEPKLSFSAFFRLCKRSGNLIQDPAPWFAKTAISSVCRLNYDQAQEVIDDIEIEETKRPAVHGGYTWQEIKDDIKLLYEVCGKVRMGRLTGGAMTISKTKMIFHTMDSEDGIPTGYHLESHSASHWVIEELMLLANRCVATRLFNSAIKDFSVLRNHKPPENKKVPVEFTSLFKLVVPFKLDLVEMIKSLEEAQTLQKLMRERLGIKDFDMSCANAIYKSCQDIYEKHGKMLGLCVEMMVMRAGMQQAEYFVCGVDDEEDDEPNPHHFALNFDYYTHFTSPIRRYPDVMVHRVLHALLENQLKPSERGESGETEVDDENEDEDENPTRTHYFQSRKRAKEQVKICNTKKVNSRRCQEQLDRAVFCIFLRSMKSWFYTVGTVLSLNHSARDGDGISIYCSQLGRESKVALRSQDPEDEESNESKLELFMNGVDDELMLPKNWEWQGRGGIQITWKSPDGSEEHIQKLQMLSCAPIVIIPTNTVPIDYAMFLVSPFHQKFNQVRKDIATEEVDGFAWADEEDEEGVETCYDASGYPEAA